MKIKKILLVLTIICLTFNSYSDTKDELLKKTITQLKETTTLLEQAKNTIVFLKNKNQALELENKKIKEELLKAKEQLKESNEVLEKLKNRVIDDQKEIKTLRDNLQKTLNAIQKDKYIRAGIGITYPYGVQILTSFKIPQTLIFGFGTLNGFYSTNLNILLTLGIGMEF